MFQRAFIEIFSTVFLISCCDSIEIYLQKEPKNTLKMFIISKCYLRACNIIRCQPYRHFLTRGDKWNVRGSR